MLSRAAFHLQRRTAGSFDVTSDHGIWDRQGRAFGCALSLQLRDEARSGQELTRFQDRKSAIVVLACCEAPVHRASGEQPVTSLLGERSLGGPLDMVTLKFFLNNPFFLPS